MYYPLQSLKSGHWFKLICGASFQHLPAVRNLTLAYTLAGADCIDVAADPAVISATREAIRAADPWIESARRRGFQVQSRPWLMVSLNDGEDPHFRKASFNPAHCPTECLRPCERICPAQAIVFNPQEGGYSGVLDSSCYGCGRCLPVCPAHLISTRSYVSTPAAIAPLVLQGVDGVEIHTQVGRLDDFKRLWGAIAPFANHLRVIAISCPDGEGLVDYLWALYHLLSPLPCPLIWQTDGRPMSGDIGDGATRAAIRVGQKVLAAQLPGYVQLAGGTNASTVSKLQTLGLLKSIQGMEQPWDSAVTLKEEFPYVAGIGYGSYARSLLAPILERLDQAIAPCDSGIPTARLESFPHLLWEAVSAAYSLVSQLKVPMNHRHLVST